MKKIFSMVCACLLALSAQATDIKKYDALYENLPFQMEKVTRPQFPANEVNLKGWIRNPPSAMGWRATSERFYYMVVMIRMQSTFRIRTVYRLAGRSHHSNTRRYGSDQAVPD